MRSLRLVAVFAICALGLSLLANASQNKFGVADSRNLQITSPTLVGTVLLPAGDYQVLHTMQGADHIMVFRQLRTRKPAEARVKCQLVPLTTKAQRDEQGFVINAANERVLHYLVFKGDLARHEF
jgi:hypothetical protein